VAKLVCFDLEGPLSPQDNAYELMGVLERGREIFEVISLYDDLLTLKRRPGYEPGGTLALIAPLLVLHALSEADIRRVSDDAPLMEGAVELIARLHAEGWAVHIISTSYSQHAYNLGAKLGVPIENVACTRFTLDAYCEEFRGASGGLRPAIEEEILRLAEAAREPAMAAVLDKLLRVDLTPDEERAVAERLLRPLDELFREKLAECGINRLLEEVEVVGGARKARAAERFAQQRGLGLGDIVAVGDSITDGRMLEAVGCAGGVGIAFNANRYALCSAAIGVASSSIANLWPILAAWDRAGWPGVREAIAEQAGGQIAQTDPYYSLLDESTSTDVELVHAYYRKRARGEAARLG